MLLSVGSIPISHANNSAGEVPDDDREHETESVGELCFHDGLSSERSADLREVIAILADDPHGGAKVIFGPLIMMSGPKTSFSSSEGLAMRRSLKNGSDILKIESERP